MTSAMGADARRHTERELRQSSDALEFLRDGADVGRVPVAPLATADAQGRTQYIAAAPIGQFAPGNYAGRFTVRQGAEVAQEGFAVNLEP